MRNKDENKKLAIFNAAVELITQNGLADTSMSMIGKAAGISSSTIYVYFNNKEDMLNKLYLWIKEESSHILLNGLGGALPVKEGIKQFWHNIYSYIMDEPVKFAFSEQFAHSPLLNKLSKAEGSRYYQPLFDLLQRGIGQGVIKDVPVDLLSAQIIAPVMYLAKQRLEKEIGILDEMLEDAFSMTWDAIRA